MTHQFKAGDLLEIKDGAYTDHQVDTPCRVLKDFDMKEVVAAYLAINPEEREDYHARFFRFKAFLTREDYTEDEPNATKRIWLGAYGTWAKELLK